MKIEGPTNNPLYFKDLEKNNPVKNDKPLSIPENQQKSSVRIEISDEAKKLMSKQVTPKDFERIRERMQSNFYNTDESINKVADKIMNEMKI